MERSTAHVFDGERDLTGEVQVNWDYDDMGWWGQFALPSGTCVWSRPVAEDGFRIQFRDGRYGYILITRPSPDCRAAMFIGAGVPPHAS